MASKDEYDVNPFAAPETDFESFDQHSSDGKWIYANFWQRFVAAFVDGIITQIIAFVLGAGAGAVLGLTLGEGGPIDLQAAAQIVGGIIGLLTAWLYSALQESSESRATLGKKLMGLKVIDMNGGQISFGQATGRYFGKIISSLICLIGYLMQPFTEKKQALHDRMAGCLVIKE